MNAEEIMREASQYDRGGECFIHIQRSEGSPFSLIESGDPIILIRAVYRIICEIEDTFDFPFKKIMQAIIMLHNHKKRYNSEYYPEDF